MIDLLLKQIEKLEKLKVYGHSGKFMSIAFDRIIFTIFQSLMFVKFANETSRKRQVNRTTSVIGTLIFVLLVYLFIEHLYKFGYWIPYLLSISLCVIYSLYFYSNHFIEDVVLSSIYFIMFWVISFMFSKLENNIFNYLDKSHMNLYGLMIVKFILIYLVIAKVMIRFIDYKKYAITNKEFFLLMFFCLIGIISIIFYTSHISAIIGVVCSVAVIVVSYDIMVIKQNQEKEKLLFERNVFLEEQDKLIKEKEEEKYKSYQRSVELDAQVRRINHDLMHHFNYLLSCEGLPKQARNYINDLKGVVESSSLSFNTGSSILDLILEEKKSECDKIGVKFMVMGDLSEGVELEPASLSIIFGNLLNNAIEGVKKIPQDRYRSIDLMFYQDPHEKFYLKLSNTAITEDIKIENGKIETTKDNKEFHGIGISSVKKEVEKYKGITKFLVGEDTFTVEISIPVKI